MKRQVITFNALGEGHFGNGFFDAGLAGFISIGEQKHAMSLTMAKPVTAFMLLATREPQNPTLYIRFNQLDAQPARRLEKNLMNSSVIKNTPMVV